MFVKLIRENDLVKLEPAPVLLRDNEKTYSNPSETTLRAFGYKSLIKTEKPVRDGFYYVLDYVETETDITEVWLEYEIPAPVVEEPVIEVVEEQSIESEQPIVDDVVEEPVAESVPETETIEESEPVAEESPAENVQEVENTEE